MVEIFQKNNNPPQQSQSLVPVLVSLLSLVCVAWSDIILPSQGLVDWLAS